MTGTGFQALMAAFSSPHKNSSFCFYFTFCFLETESCYVALADLTLSMYSRLTLNSQPSSCPSLQSTGIIDTLPLLRRFQFCLQFTACEWKWTKQIPGKWLISEIIFIHMISLTIQDSLVHLTYLLARDIRCQKYPANEKVCPYSNGYLKNHQVILKNSTCHSTTLEIVLILTSVHHQP